MYEGKDITWEGCISFQKNGNLSTFRLHSAIKKHCQITFYANRNSIESYFMNFWTEKIFN